MRFNELLFWTFCTLFFRFSPVATMFKKDSGHAKRKQKAEKLKREEELRERTPRLTTYFSRKTTTEQQAAAAEAETTNPDIDII